MIWDVAEIMAQQVQTLVKDESRRFEWWLFGVSERRGEGGEVPTSADLCEGATDPCWCRDRTRSRAEESDAIIASPGADAEPVDASCVRGESLHGRVIRLRRAEGRTPARSWVASSPPIVTTQGSEPGIWPVF